MRLRGQSVLIVDVVGGVLAGVLAASGTWHAFLRPNTAAAELSSLRGALADKTRDAATLEYELGKQKALEAERKEVLSVTGTPPAEAPIEDHLRTLADLARRNAVRLAAVTPVGAAGYSGVREVRYHVAGQGAYADLTKLLREFEACDFWGDITHLRIGRLKNSPGEQAEEREMELTVGFYSAAAVTGRPEDPH